jgi:precorrin-6A/cobalt-precorrin-6A reductase
MRTVSTFAGRVQNPRLPEGEVRIGGFGGLTGLIHWLQDNHVSAIMDATHPFAERISRTAAEAAHHTGTPILLLRRPGWTPAPGDTWHWVDSLPAAAAALPNLTPNPLTLTPPGPLASSMAPPGVPTDPAAQPATVPTTNATLFPGRRVFLTTGRQGLSAFAAVSDFWFLVRCVDPPDPPMPPRMHLLLDRGPYTVAGELALMREHRIDILITKDSGGELTSAKLHAARELGIPVIMVRRPEPPDVPTVATVAEALSWLDNFVG